MIKLWSIKPIKVPLTKSYMWFFFLWTRVLCSSLKGINNNSIKCLLKTFLQAKWVLIRGTLIHFVMTDHEISTFIFSSTHNKKNKIKENLILILLYINATFWIVKFKGVFCKNILKHFFFCSVRKNVLKNLANITEKHLC